MVNIDGLLAAISFADYFIVESSVFQRCYQRNADEIDTDGVVHKSTSDFSHGHDVQGKNLRGYKEFDFDGMTIRLPHSGKSHFFSLHAVLRFAMFLRDSAVAKEIRTQMINVYDDVSVVQRTRHMTEEQDFMMDAIKGYEDNDSVRIFESILKLAKYANRHKLAAQELMVKTAALAESNASLETANLTLSGDTLTSKPRSLICRIIRAYANMRLFGDHARAWGEFYQWLAYQASINVKTRKGFKNSWMDTIREDELDACVKIAASICNRAGLDVSRIVRETNAEAYGDLLAFDSDEQLLCQVTA